MIFAADFGSSRLKVGILDYNANLLDSRIICGRDEGLSLRDAFVSAVASFDSGLKSAVSYIAISGAGPSFIPVLSDASDFDAASCKPVLYSEDGGFIIPNAMRLKKDSPDIYASSKFFMGSYEFISYLLTGIAKTIIPSRGMEQWYWNRKTLLENNLDPDKFPPLAYPGGILGRILPEAASFLGFNPDASVLAPVPDFLAGILSTGVKNIGQCHDRTGTTEGLNAVSSRFVTHPQHMCYTHPADSSLYNVSSIFPTCLTNPAEYASAVKQLELDIGCAITEIIVTGALATQPELLLEREHLCGKPVRALASGEFAELFGDASQVLALLGRPYFPRFAG